MSALNFERDNLIAMHPVVLRDFHIPTAPVRDVVDIALRVIATGSPAGAFKAPPRFGKTYASEYLQSVLRRAYPGVPIVLYSAQLEKIASPGKFFTGLLEQSEIDRALHFPRGRERIALQRAWWAMASQPNSRRFIFIIDEAQRLTESEFTWLSDSFNLLHKQKIRVSSLLFCQTGIEARRTELLENGRADIVCRFMPRVHPFHGITSCESLKDLMKSYDDPMICDFPSSSGCSFTAFFLPKAYSKGWRLETQAELLWNHLRKACGEHEPSLGFGMEWVTGALQFVLTHFAEHDQTAFELQSTDWEEAVESTGLGELQSISPDFYE